MLQYKIPQNVGIEDKIVGPLTLRQLIILSVGIGTSYVLFAILNRLYELNILEYIVIIIPAAIAAAAALIKIRELTFTQYLLYLIEFSIKPRKRVWDHRGIASLVSPDLYDYKAPEASAKTKKEEAAKEAAEKKGPVNLEKLGHVLDSNGFEHIKAETHEDMDKAHDDTMVAQAFLGHKKNETENMYWRTAETHKERLKHLAKKSDAKPAKTATATLEKTEAAAEAPASTKNTRPRRKPAPKARPEAQVNTLQKEHPVKEPKTPQKEQKETPPKLEDGEKSGEFQFEELKQGEIEINLD